MYFIQVGHPESAVFQKSQLRMLPDIFWAISTTGSQSGKIPMWRAKNSFSPPS